VFASIVESNFKMAQQSLPPVSLKQITASTTSWLSEFATFVGSVLTPRVRFYPTAATRGLELPLDASDRSQPIADRRIHDMVGDDHGYT
jgi:hypothetical protein